MKVNELELAFSVITPIIRHADELEVRAVLTNTAMTPIRLNTLCLNFPVIVLNVQTEKGAAVPLGPPPFPPADDGDTGRIDLKPNQSVRYVYYGTDLFGGERLPEGTYGIRFRYDNDFEGVKEWKGMIETEWITFKIEGL